MFSVLALLLSGCSSCLIINNCGNHQTGERLVYEFLKSKKHNLEIFSADLALNLVRSSDETNISLILPLGVDYADSVVTVPAIEADPSLPIEWQEIIEKSSSKGGREDVTGITLVIEYLKAEDLTHAIEEIIGKTEGNEDALILRRLEIDVSDLSEGEIIALIYVVFEAYAGGSVDSLCYRG